MAHDNLNVPTNVEAEYYSDSQKSDLSEDEDYRRERSSYYKFANFKRNALESIKNMRTPKLNELSMRSRH